MTQPKQLIALDIGEKRIGVAVADTEVRIAIPVETIAMNESTFREDIARLVTKYEANEVIVGYPRNQSGEPTAQTHYVEACADQLDDIDATVKFQDESLTSVIAEQRLKAKGGSIEKGDIDAEAAAIILNDYLEQRR